MRDFLGISAICLISLTPPFFKIETSGVCENKSGELRSCTSCIIRQGFKDVVGELTENGATSHSRSVSITPLFPLKRGERGRGRGGEIVH
jgi:hypothetical protein